MRRNATLLALVVGGVLFLAGLSYLFLLRFAAGDVYAPHSSLRADPLGTMAFYESLEQLPGLDVRRDTSDSNRLPSEPHTTYLHLSAETETWRVVPVEVYDEAEKFMLNGGRLVITLFPATTRPTAFTTPPPFSTPTNAPATNAPGRVRNRNQPGKSKAGAEETLAKRWGADFEYVPLILGSNGIYRSDRATNQSTLSLPAALDWHSAVVLTNLDASWQPLYARAGNPVLAERHFGRGSVVLATDTYFLSNEALWRHREPALLAWLVGPAEHVVFDEAHLGVAESPGVADLMQKYRLTGVLAALVSLALLFVWKNSFSLLPPRAVAAAGAVAGKDAATGFVNLLQRNIPPRQILETCFEQWSRSLLQRANFHIAAVDQAQTIMERERARPPAERRPVQTYRDIALALQALSKGKKPTPAPTQSTA